MVDRKLKRRDFLKLTTVAAAGAVAAACTPAAQPTAQPPAPAEPTQAAAQPTMEIAATLPPATVEAPSTRAEPPMLAELVKGGKLPGVEERLPQNPLVVNVEKVGTYGDEIRMVHFDPTWFVSNYDMVCERYLHYSDADMKTIVPNIFESWEVTPDGKSYTIKMRKGMKWSDGQPLTTEDLDFWWNDFINNKDLNSGMGWQWRFGGEPMKVDIVDDYTFKLTFAAPFGNFPAHLTRMFPTDNLILPKHYMKQFHPKYGKKEDLDKMIKDLKLENVGQLFTNKTGWGIGVWYGPDNYKEYPVISPWHMVDRPQEGLYLWERNPYYWKVDTAGNQLPYIDKMRYDYVQTTEATKLKLVQSELDIVSQHDVTIADYPYYKENESKANYVVGDYISCMMDRFVLFPQMVVKDDPVLSKIFQTPDFIKALSLGIDREEINQSIYFGQAKMGQLSPMPVSKYYKPKYGEAWAQYDVDQANKLLDDMGLKKGADGIRMRPDGKPLELMIEHAGVRVGTSAPQYVEMVVTYWNALGIKTTAKEGQESLINERLQNGQVQVTIWHADRCTDMLLHIEPQWYIPTYGGGQGGASSLWGKWYNAADKKAEGLVEPPDNIKKLYDTFDKMTSVVDENERVKLGQEIFDYLADNPLEIGSVMECPAPLIFNKNMRNLPRAKVLIGWDSYGLSTYHPEGFYYEGGKRA